MKKTIFISALVSSFLTFSFALAVDTLWEFFGGHLPSISERALIYEGAGYSDVYKGTAKQNRTLLSYLERDIRLGYLAPPSSTVEGTSTAGWTDDGSIVRLNTAGDSVGIGTANPADKLSVVGGNISVSGDISLSGGDLNIGGSNSTSTLTVSGGLLGIGSTTPRATLSVQGNLMVSGTTTTGVLQATSTLIASTTRFSGGVQYSWPQTDGSTAQILQTNGSGTLSWVSSATTYLGLSDTDPTSFTANRIPHTNSGATGLTDTDGFVLSGGKLGVSTTSPYAPLSVVGQIVGAYFTATTSSISTFPYASSTATTVSGTASTSALIVSNTATLPIYATTSAGQSSANGVNEKVTATAICLSGDIAISGGYNPNDIAGSFNVDNFNRTTYSTAGDAWTTTLDTIDSVTATLTTTAYCLNQ